MIIADTDVLIDFLRDGGAARRVETELRTSRLATTVIAAFELWQGARGVDGQAQVETLLAALDVLPLTADSARRAGQVRRALLARRLDIGVADSLVAGICLELGATLLTGNASHFERVPELRLSGRYT